MLGGNALGWTPIGSTFVQAGNIDAATIPSITSLLSTESTNYNDSATPTSKTTPSGTDTQTSSIFTDSATVSGKTSLLSFDQYSHTDSATPTSITTPDIIIEIATTINLDLSLSGSTYVGGTLTATIVISVTGGTTAGGGGGVPITDPDSPGYTVVYSPGGDWGTSDTDNGIIP